MSEAVRYQEMLELLRESCASGTLNSVRASLPEHYIGVQSVRFFNSKDIFIRNYAYQDVKAFSPEVLKLSDQMRWGSAALSLSFFSNVRSLCSKTKVFVQS